jgi:DNA primase
VRQLSDPVLDLLNKKGLEYRVSGRDYLIHCLNPDHDDKDPSFRVDKVTGVAHCFSCGFKTNIFKFYGVLTNHTSIKVAKLKEKLGELKVSFEGYELPEGATPFTGMFRGISKETLQHFEAFTTYQEEKLADRLVFPIYDIRGKVAVFNARHMLSNGNPRYINYPAHVTLPIYPVKYPGQYKSAVLVEGLFDMLNLYDRGLKNVTACFGTNSLQKDTGLKLLPLKAQGITHIYILFDGDDAGREAAVKLKPLIEEHDFLVEVVDLPNGMDPGDLDQEYVDSINEYVNKG